MKIVYCTYLFFNIFRWLLKFDLISWRLLTKLLKKQLSRWHTAFFNITKNSLIWIIYSSNQLSSEIWHRAVNEKCSIWICFTYTWRDIVRTRTIIAKSSASRDGQHIVRFAPPLWTMFKIVFVQTHFLYSAVSYTRNLQATDKVIFKVC